MSLAERTNDIVDQLTRYGGEVASDELADVLWQLTDVNDDMHRGRDPEVILAAIEKTERLLAALKATVRR